MRFPLRISIRYADIRIVDGDHVVVCVVRKIEDAEWLLRLMNEDYGRSGQAQAA